MTTTRSHRAANAVPQSGCTSAFLDSLAAQDFARLGGTLAADARMRALLPAGPREWAGADAIANRFAGWFIVEQQAYADTGEDGRLAWLDLLCTGYRSEAGHD